jgi:hypothetical protein
MIKINTNQAISSLNAYLKECDSDELARLLGEIFGGQCFQNTDNPDIYDFEPNEFYTGQFDNKK